MLSLLASSSQSLTLSQGGGCDHHQLLNWLCRACDDPRSATAPLLSPRLAHGTVCLTHCTNCHHWNNSRNFWKLIYLKSHLRNRTVCDCKALLKQRLLSTVLLHYIYITSVSSCHPVCNGLVGNYTDMMWDKYTYVRSKADQEPVNLMHGTKTEK